jgi:hypothetical protein
MTPPTVALEAAAADAIWLVGPPVNPELRRIGEQIITELRAASIKALANAADANRFPLTPEATLEQLFLRRFKQKPASRLEAAAARALTAGEGLPGIDLHSAVPVAAQLEARRPALALSRGSLEDAAHQPARVSPSAHYGLEAIADEDDPITVKPFLRPEALKAVTPKGGLHVVLKPRKPTLQHLPAYTGVQLRLGKMRCIEVTGGGGADQIALGGIAVAANGATHKIEPFMVSNDFDAGEFVRFGPTTFFRFNYNQDDHVKVPGRGLVRLAWPRTFHVTFLVAEVDNGGFPEFVNDLFEKVKEKAVAAVAAAVGAWIGGTAASELPVLGTAIGAAIGALCGWVLGELWSAFVDWWEDDEFPPVSVAVKRTSPLSRFKNETSYDSTNNLVWWKADGGYYKLAFDWQVVGSSSPAH